MIPGYGDEATWPTFSGAHGDPRESVAPVDDVEQAQNLITKIRGQIDRAETAVFRRDWETYRLDQDSEFPFLACELDLELMVDGEEFNGEIKTVHPFAARSIASVEEWME